MIGDKKKKRSLVFQIYDCQKGCLLSNVIMNGGSKKRLNPSVSISQVSLPYLYIETEKYKKKSVKHIIKSMKQKHGSNSYMVDATEAILFICKCLQSIMPVTNIFQYFCFTNFMICFIDFMMFLSSYMG